MLCDACGAVAIQLARAFAAKAGGGSAAKAGGGGRPGPAARKLKEFEVLDTIEAVCAGELPRYTATGDEVEQRGGHAWEQPATWDEYGVADMNATCASPPEVSCWNSTKSNRRARPCTGPMNFSQRWRVREACGKAVTNKCWQRRAKTRSPQRW